jgi:hypothetical protein
MDEFLKALLVSLGVAIAIALGCRMYKAYGAEYTPVPLQKHHIKVPVNVFKPTKKECHEMFGGDWIYFKPEKRFLCVPVGMQYTPKKETRK